MKITIAYVTSRRTPRFDWFCDSLVTQTTPEQRADLQVVFVDGHLYSTAAGFWSHYFGAPVDGDFPFAHPAYHDPHRREELARIVAGRFNYLHIPPKPSAWQGPWRQTTKDYFCAANTRNTAFIVAQHPYVVFCDDLSVLKRDWFDQVRHAAQHEYIVCGAYKKVLELEFTTEPYHMKWQEYPPGVDSRWERGSDQGAVQWRGSELYGCSFGVPLEAALEVDGHDAACNGAGAEDYDFGIRIERAGWAIFYNRNMLTLESHEAHFEEESLPRERKMVSPDRLPPGYEGEHWSDHVMLNRVVRETDRILPLIGDNLRAVRKRYLETGLVPVPREPVFDWRDGAALSSL